MPAGFAIILPARFHSTRFPGKPLALIAGKPLIEWVYARAAQVPGAERVIVATDHEGIRDAVQAFGGEAVMTSMRCATGTDRVAEIARSLTHDPIVNLQGDEPLFPVDLIVEMARVVSEESAADRTDIVTACHPLQSREEASNPNVVKVVMDEKGRALYFSRAAIPYHRNEAGTSERPERPERPGTKAGTRALRDGHQPGRLELERPLLGYRHVGIYVFRRASLLRFASLPQTPLERAEGLEQLRALEHGMVIRVLQTLQPTVGVDVPEDVKMVEKALARE